MHGYADYLEELLGVRPVNRVQLPIIPLGVDCEQFFPRRTRMSAGRSGGLNWKSPTAMSLFCSWGRLSFTTKAHPLPMFLALEETARQTGKPVCLILAGWFDPPTIEALWKADAAKYCPSVRVIVADGRQDDVRGGIWSAADIFTSLSDNIQETFGLTPIEAMAAGLPVVVTDWDGLPRHRPP